MEALSRFDYLSSVGGARWPWRSGLGVLVVGGLGGVLGGLGGPVLVSWWSVVLEVPVVLVVVALLLVVLGVLVALVALVVRSWWSPWSW